MNTWTRVLCAVLSVTVIGGFPALTFGQPYNFINIADDSGPFSNISFDSGAMNDDGIVAFMASLDSGVQGVFTGNGGPITTIADSTGVYAYFSPKVDINNSGTVAFAARWPFENTGIYAKNGNVTTTIAIGGSGSQFDLVDRAAINETNAVAFFARTNPNSGGFYVSDNGSLAAIVEGLGTDTDLSISDFGINDGGTVAFFHAEVFNEGQGRRLVIRSGNGGPLTTIATSVDYPFLSLGNLINDAGTVIFNGIDRANRASIGPFTSNGGPVTAIIGTSGTGLRPVYNEAMAINNSGDVAFIGRIFGDQVRGIYTGPDPVTDRVIREGDPLFGSTVSSLFGAILTLNEKGSIAFHYELANGVRGLAVASVPEPVSAMMFICAAATMPLLMRRRPSCRHSRRLSRPQG